jgi:hypothetical protein
LILSSIAVEMHPCSIFTPNIHISIPAVPTFQGHELGTVFVAEQGVE